MKRAPSPLPGYGFRPLFGAGLRPGLLAPAGALSGTGLRALSCAGLCAIALTGCTRGGGGSSESLFRLRNAGRLQAARDTQEGYDEAARAFADAQRESRDAGDLLNLARCLILGGRPQEAKSALEAAQRALPEGAALPTEVLYLEGLVSKGLKSYADAAARFREVTGRDPGLETGWYQLGTALALAGSHSESVKAFEKLIELNPEHVSAHYKRSMAYRALGDAARAEDAMARFLELKKKGGQDAGEETAYERCKYTKVTLAPPAGAASEPAPVPVTFEDATAAAGLAGPGAGDGAAALEAAAVAVVDFDHDGDPDLYLARKGPNRLLRNDRGRFCDVTDLSDAGDPGDAVGAEAADFNNDGLPDIFVVNRGGPCVLLKGLGEGVFQPLPRSGLALEGVNAARWVDYDHDGDLDLVTLEAASPDAPRAGAPPAGPAVHRNNGDETFALEDALLAGSPSAASIVFGDFDRGNDVDFAFGDAGGPARLCLNLRKGPFRGSEVAGLAGHALLGATDVNGDGDLDLVGAPWGSVPLRLALSGGPQGAGRAPRFSVTEPAGGSGLGTALSMRLLDLDNDGDDDLLLGTSGSGLVLFSGRAGGLERCALAGAGSGSGGAGAGVGGSAAGDAPVSFIATLDVEGDGNLDLLLSCGPGGRVKLLKNVSRTPYAAVTIRPVGSRDNKDGIGASIELLSGSHYQRRLVGSAGGARFGLGNVPLEALDGFEILWPNGIAQPLLREDLKWDAWRSLEVTQKRGLTVSCPFLFVHDGRGWRFLTDVVGIAPLDEWLPEGVHPHLDPEEPVRIPVDALRESGGRLRAAITEELRETTYLDRVRLLRVAAPRGTLVHADESTRQGGMEPLAVWIARESGVIPSPGVRGDDGRDFTREAAAKDREYLHPYGSAPPQWAGWVPSHALEMEIPRGPSSNPALLLLDGRIYWPDSSVTFALSQHGRSWAPPRLEAVLADGSARTVLADIGFPCGMDRTMVIPLAAAGPGGPQDPYGSGARAFRIVANHRFLWDRIAFALEAAHVVLGEDGVRSADLAGERVELCRETLPLAAAELGYHGFSRVVGDVERHEQTYDFSVTAPGPAFQVPAGRATGHGDVRELLSEPDSRLVVMVPGDVVRLEFEARPLPGGLEATYFLLVTGWAKEASFHNPTGRTIEPLPFHGMDGYPPRNGGARAAEGLTRSAGDP